MEKINPSRQLIRAVPTELQPEYLGIVGAQGSSPFGEVQLREYWKVILKYRRLILSGTFVCALLALLYCFTVTPLFTSSATIRISTYQPVLSSTSTEDRIQQQSEEQRYFDTQLQELKSLSLADRVLLNSSVRVAVERLAKSDTTLSNVSPQVANETYTNSAPLLNSYLSIIAIRPLRKTNLVIIDATHRDPQRAAEIANLHAKAYIDWVRDTRVSQQARGVKFLRSQELELRTKVVDLEREMADYAEDNSIVAVNKDENIVVQKMSKLNQMLTNVTAKRIEAEQLYKEAREAGAEQGAGIDDESVHKMRSELGSLEAKYSQLLQKFTPSYPKVQQIKSQIDGLRRSITDQRKSIVEGLRAKAAAAAMEESKLREELERQKSQAFELSKRQVHYNVLDRELTSSRDLLSNVMRQIKELSLAAESNASNVSIVDFAVAPSAASFPRTNVIVLLGALFGLGAGIACAFFLSYLDNTLRTPEDVQQVVKLPNLGVVPSFSVEGLEHRRPELLSSEAESNHSSGEISSAPVPLAQRIEKQNSLVFNESPKSLVAEAYRTIRTGVLLSQAGEPPRTLLVTSAQSSEGKTTLSCNLAASLVSAGARVVLLDGDLRRPSVHKQFGLPYGAPGLVEVLTGQAVVRDAACEVSPSGLTVIPSGKIPPNPAELLGSREMERLLMVLGREFDYVIIDCPPVISDFH